MARDDGLYWLGELDQNKVAEEDLAGKGKGKYTVEGIDPNDPDWLEKAAAKTQAVSGDTYVKLDCGLLTVNQINWLLRSVFGELTYCDDNHQLLWYNKNPDPNYRMMGKRRPDQIGSPMSEVHPNRGNVFKYVKQVWYGLRTKATGRSEVWTPVSMGHGQPILHYNRYKRIEDEEGNFRGIMEWVVDLQPLAEYYLKTNGLKAVKDEHPQRPDLVPSPGDIALEKKRQSTDANTAASQH